MRGAIGRRLPGPDRCCKSVLNHTRLIQPSFHFSSFSGSGRGRGAGAGDEGHSDGPGQFNFGRAPEIPSERENLEPEAPSVGHGHGRGRGLPIPSDAVSPTFSAFVSSIRPASAAIGRGRGAPGLGPVPPSATESSLPSKPNKPEEEPRSTQQVQEANRDVRPAQPQLVEVNTEEQVKNALSALSRGNDSNARGRGRGGRGRGRGGGRGRGRGRVTEEWKRDEDDSEDPEVVKMFAGDDADGEKFAKKVGPEIMSKLEEAFEEICDRAIPSPAEDAFVDAYETNLMIECEPEYLMADFDSNPDIDEKPPISLRDALEKVKPFIMCYEGIKDQEEWEEAVEQVMKTAPLMKKIVDHYSGPDRVTAKKQTEELERVAKTIPMAAPDSVKRFADRAVITLQSNPGWGFDKKCQFMDKLVWEVQQQYK